MFDRRACHFDSRLGTILLATCLAIVLGSPLTPRTLAQTPNPVYMDESSEASGTFLRVQDHLAAKNLTEAARVLQVLLIEQPYRLVARSEAPPVPVPAPDPAEAPPAADSRNLFVSVRSEVHRTLLENPDLLERYRQIYEPIAQNLLADGRVDTTETAYLLTTSGFDAALALSRRHLERARFTAALLTLTQLESHPDASATRAAQASGLVAQLSRYIDSPVADRLSTRWAAAGSAGLAKFDWPRAAMLHAVTPLDVLGPADLSQVLGKPLRSSTYGGEELSESLADSAAGADRDRLPPFAKRLSVIPAVAGDTLYINDGDSITAWDRITLTRRWKSEPIPMDPRESEDNLRAGNVFGARQRAVSFPEELISVTASARDVVGTTGMPVGGIRTGDPRVHSIDAGTGLVRWSVNIPDLDPQLQGVSVRGPIVLSEGTAVLLARRAELDRRQISIYLLGLDLANGQLLWHRLMGSTGALPYRQDVYVSDSGILLDGIVYRGDMLGILGAYEAVSGRPVWVRRIPAESAQLYDSLAPWHMCSPLVHADHLIVLSPDRREVLRINRSTGELISRTRSDKFGSPTPKYILTCGDSLIAVADSGCVVAPLNSFESSGVQTISDFGEIGIRGRVTSVGGRLLIPTTTGLSIYDPARLDQPPTQIDLDNPGNFLALDSQLVVVDDAFVHSYLLWEAAERVLTDRMRAEPAEPAAAVTLAELAYRAGKHDRIVPAADAALNSITLAGALETASAARSRLFDSLHQMAMQSMDPLRTERPAAPLPGDINDKNAADLAPPIPVIEPLPPPPRITDPAMLALIIERLRLAASSPDQRVAYLLAQGRFDELAGNFPAAVDSYQSILDSPQLAGATWNGPRLSTRGELEVTRRLERLVRDQGTGVYTTHDQAAAAEFQSLGASPETDALLSLASRYPVASIAPTIWERLADTYAQAGRGPAVIGALESGLEAAERRPDASAVARLVGRLLSEMESRGQLTAASSLLRSILADHPDLNVTFNGSTTSLRDLSSQLSQRIAARHRWPSLGPATGDGIQVLQGWTLIDPIIRERFGSVPAAAMLRAADQVALWMPSDQIDADPNPSAPKPPTPASPSDQPLKQLGIAWKKPVDITALVELIKLDNESAYIFASTGGSASVEKVSLTPARSRWQTELFSQDPAGAAPPNKPSKVAPDERIPTPQDGPSLYNDLLTVLDERTLAFVERTGRACAIDAQSGEPLWTLRSPLDRVYDVALSPSALVLSGDQEIIGAGGRPVGWRPEIVVLDPRTGQEIQRLPQRWGLVRWIRLTDSGDLIAGCEQAIVCTDLARVQTNWVLSDHRVVGSREAWIFGDSLFLLDRDRELWLLAITSGELGKQPLAAPRAHLGGLRSINAFALPSSITPPPTPDAQPIASQPSPPTPSSNIAFSTFQGVMIYGADGSFKGIDAVGGFDGLLPPAPSDAALVTITTMPDGRRGDGELIYTLHYLDTSTAMLNESVPIVLGAPPRSFTMLDGRLVLTAGGTTLVLQSPKK